MLDVLFPTSDELGGNDAQPSFFSVALAPPPGDDAVINAVPEPGLLSLFGVALFGLVRIMKRTTPT
ncbi:PEP-CTERM sorting domain-containing protein [Chitinimonas naiadis]